VAGNNISQSDRSKVDKICTQVIRDANKPNGDSKRHRVQVAIRILQDATGNLYIDPDAQHYQDTGEMIDLLDIYSKEIQALRRIVELLMTMGIRMQEIFEGSNLKPVDLISLNEVQHYLEAATWCTSLIFDPERGSTLPDSKD